MPPNKLKINLFGEAWKLKQISISEEQKIQWKTIAQRMKQPLCQAIADPYFYYLLKEDAIQSIENINGTIWEGLLNTPKNQIEIWYKNKKVQKLKINDLKEELLLFPLYHTTVSKIASDYEKGIYIEQKGIGLVASYEIRIDHFNIDNLVFHLSETNDMSLLQKLTYQNQSLILKKNDLLIMSQNGFEVNK